MPRSPEVAHGRRRGRVLDVDDETIILKIVQCTLSAQHEVVVIAVPQEALDRISSGERIDLILCDLLMPEMTGMDFYDRLVRVALDQALNIVFFTGGVAVRSVQAFLDELPNQLLDKPFEPATLRALVDDRLRR